MEKQMSRPKFASSSVNTESDNGEITFIAARNVKNLNGWTYDVKSLMAQDSTGEYKTLTNEAQEVSIPLMVDHSGSTKDKIGSIYEAKIVTDGEIDHVEMKAKFFKGDEAQEIRQRILDNELTDVSITTDWGSGYDDEDDFDLLKNSHIIEVSVVYAGAEPKAKILAKNSVNKDEEDKKAEQKKSDDDVASAKAQEDKIKNLEAENSKLKAEAEAKAKEEEEAMAKQPTNGAATEKTADKALVLNTLATLAQNGSIRGMNRSQVIEAVKNEIVLKDGGSDYVVPDAIFTEILAATRPTDILDTFRSLPVKRFTLMAEQRSEADLARAGKWSKGEQKDIQAATLQAQKFATDFIYKLQELSYADLQEDFGDILYAFVRNELPQKVSEEEERAFIVGDGRSPSDNRHITSIVSLDAAAESGTNTHVYKYDGSGDSSAVAALLNGAAKMGEDGVTYAVMNKTTLANLRASGLDTATGLPFSEETVAGAIGVDRIFTRDYVAVGVVYLYIGSRVYRLTGGQNGETIEQYDIDYNNRKIEFIRPAGGGASGVYSAVKVILPTVISA